MSPAASIALDIHQRLNQVRVRLYKTEAVSRAYLVGAIILASLGFVALLEMIFHFGTAVRTVLFIVGLAAYVVCVIWMVLRPFSKAVGILPGADDLVVAKRVGDFFPSIRDRLTNFLQLQEESSRGDSLYSPELLEASFNDIAGDVRPVDFNRAVDESAVGRMRRWFISSAAGAALFLALFPSSMPDAYLRLARFNVEFTPPPKYTFDVVPGNTEIIKGQSIDVRARLTTGTEFALLPRTLDLFYRISGQDRFDQLEMKTDSSGLYRASLQSVKISTEYFVRASDVQSQRYLLTVLDRPIIRSLRVRLDFPAYSKLPTRLQDEFSGDVTALAGTRVSLTGTASKDLRTARIVFGPDSTGILAISGGTFSGGFRLKHDGSYYIELTDRDTLTNSDPVHYNLKVIPDEWP
ncbi:MAG: hypothetical protein LUO89_05380, partial [Methanothrix sp.]|nr:hypothetical protein [Methanothrix sp.]